MNRHGQASRFAYNPQALVAYLDTLERPECYTDDHHGRIIRRWRRKAGGVTELAAAGLLADYGKIPPDFTIWCEKHSITHTLRNRTGR